MVDQADINLGRTGGATGCIDALQAALGFLDSLLYAHLVLWK
jgi:hypothetical protein